MGESFELGTLLGHVYTLKSGIQVRLRLARSSDIPSVRKLLGEQGLAPADLEAARLVHFDPRRRYVVCATGLIDGAETLLGIGAITLGVDAEPDLLVVAGERREEIAPLLTRALVGAARVLVRSRAA
jgi:hypothetical protein